MVSISINNFSLRQIDQSGQCFRMQLISMAEDGATVTYRIIAGNRCIEATQEDCNLALDCSQEEYDSFWKSYFDLDTDYSQFIALINPNDKYLTLAAQAGSGVCILKQDLWEMIVTFLISQQNNIKRIRTCIDNICREYGEVCEHNGHLYYAFPTPQALACLEEDALMACNLGYRSKYVVRTARAVVEGSINLDLIQSLPYKKASEELLKCFGVGQKVADCICLFALHHLDAFPVDTHIRQVLDEHYKRGFPNRRYKGCRGVMQQYIFYYELIRK